MTKAARWLGLDPVIFTVFAAALLALMIVLGWQLGGEDDPVRPRLFQSETLIDDAPIADLAGTVANTTPAGSTSSSVPTATVHGADDPVDISIPGAAIIQTLEPEDVPGVEPGDWVIVGGIDDNVNSFIVQGVVVVADAEVAR